MTPSYHTGQTKPSRHRLPKQVHLFLFVKVRENWAEDKERLRNMGLDV